MDSTDSHTPAPPTSSRTVRSVIIRFAGDSGDGMQLTGTRFSEDAALFGNDIATLPDFPAEIRAPAGSLAGVSGFQIQIANHDIYTAGDQPDVLVAMNPAALARNRQDLRPGGLVVVDRDAFDERNLTRAGFAADPLTDGSLDGYTVHAVPITSLTVEAVTSVEGLSPRERERSRNFFALGLSLFMFARSTDTTARWIRARFGDTPAGEANLVALRKGYDFGVTTELSAGLVIEPAHDIPAGEYRSITGNLATAHGFAAAAHLAGRDLVMAGYPITPASDILHTLAGLKRLGVRTIQAEDEIAAVCAAIGASWGGAIGLTASSGPGIALKSEAISLAVSTELPLVIIDVQRAGPSTGMPTRVEQADLFLAMFGRHGEAPAVVLAPSSPADCFAMAVEAVRLATKYMTPVFFLSDSYIANGAEPWRIPDLAELERIEVPAPGDPADFAAYRRDPDTLARPWAAPGTPGLEHRIGGLEKDEHSGHISYDPSNHDRMTRLRAERIARIAHDIPPLEVKGDVDAELLVLGWGSTAGPIHTAVDELRDEGHRIAWAHLRHLSPMPANLDDVLRRYSRVLVPEINAGQLACLLRSRLQRPIASWAHATGMPFQVGVLRTAILEQLVAAPRTETSP
jgi:2-oxoglutarate ferredoxin oxidoreductase subunit alpha